MATDTRRRANGSGPVYRTAPAKPEGDTARRLHAATWLPLWGLMGDNQILDVVAVVGLVAFALFVWRNRHG